MVKKFVNAKAKSALRPHSSTKKRDQNCLWGNRLANFTVLKGQGSTMKEPRVKKPNVWSTELLSSPQHFEFSEKSRKEKKKKQCQRNWIYQEGFTLATKVNITQSGKAHKKKKKEHCSNKAPHNTSQIKYYNYQKIGHYATTCPEPKN